MWVKIFMWQVCNFIVYFLTACKHDTCCFEDPRWLFLWKILNNYFLIITISKYKPLYKGNLQCWKSWDQSWDHLLMVSDSLSHCLDTFRSWSWITEVWECADCEDWDGETVYLFLISKCDNIFLAKSDSQTFITIPIAYQNHCEIPYISQNLIIFQAHHLLKCSNCNTYSIQLHAFSTK